MTSVFGISVSGLNAASKRLEVSANNIANKDSTRTIKDGQVTNEPYHAQRAQSISQANGGVSVVVRDENPPTVTTFNPGADNADANGQSEVPNVALEKELIDQNIASYDYKANLKAIKIQNNVFEELLRIDTKA
jgi:flagellar basal-body rod protein FlgC